MPRLDARTVLTVLCLAVSSVPSLATPATEELEQSSFQVRGKSHPLYVDKLRVALRAGAAVTEQDAATVASYSETERQAFALLGVEIVLRTSVRHEEDIVGYPVWFDRERGAVGILTHEIVVRLDDGATTTGVRQEKGFATLHETKFRAGLYLAKFSSPMAALTAANGIAAKKGVRYAHPNFLIPKDYRGSFRAGPETEPFFAKQWHLENLGQLGGTTGADVSAKGAWEHTLGTPDLLVGVLDGGFEVAHPDLEGAFFRNPAEVPGNGVDDDANGYVDDVSGWNFWAKSADVANGVLPDHGTAVAGLLGARRNAKGISGMCPECTIMPAVLAWQVAEDAAAFYYAAKFGVDVITNSWGYPLGTPTTDVIEEAIAEAARGGRDGKGTVILFAMNNIDQDDCADTTNRDPDISSLETVVAVSASSDLDKKIVGSAWGPCMEILSPSFENDRPGIATTDLLGQRGYNRGRTPATELPDLDYTNHFGGTSAATPTAAGIFALVLSVNGELTRDEAVSIVTSTADKVHPELADYDARTGFSRKYGYGRINAAKAVRAALAFKKHARRERPAREPKSIPR